MRFASASTAGGSSTSARPRTIKVASPLASTNSHEIRVVADRAPLRQDVKTAFAKGSRKATAGIDSLIKPRSHRGANATAKRS
jgi:hypothetical protein